MSEYTINPSPFPPSARCVCGHILAAHGSSGMVCCQCRCLKFEEARPPK